jgi:hypothetical protein
MYNPTRCTYFATISRKSELANNYFISPSKREKKIISKFEKYKNVDANLFSKILNK